MFGAFLMRLEFVVHMPALKVQLWNTGHRVTVKTDRKVKNHMQLISQGSLADVAPKECEADL